MLVDVSCEGVSGLCEFRNGWGGSFRGLVGNDLLLQCFAPRGGQPSVFAQKKGVRPLGFIRPIELVLEGDEPLFKAGGGASS